MITVSGIQGPELDQDSPHISSLSELTLLCYSDQNPFEFPHPTTVFPQFPQFPHPIQGHPGAQLQNAEHALTWTPPSPGPFPHRSPPSPGSLPHRAPPSPGPFPHLGSSSKGPFLTWTPPSPGLFPHLDPSLTWALPSPGPLPHLGPSLTWTPASPGPLPHLGPSFTGADSLYPLSCHPSPTRLCSTPPSSEVTF